MRIKVNERFLALPEQLTLHALREAEKPNADLLILNGFPVSDDRLLSEGDEVVLIRRGEVPSREELEILMAARHTPGVHDKVKRGVVGIAGLGGLGSSVAVALARLGVGRLILADYDVVEPSNLNRQQYFTDQIGMTKAAAMTANLHRINPYVEVSSHEVCLTPENLTEIFAGVSVIVEAFDTAEAKSMMINTVLRKMDGTFVVCASGLAGYGPSGEIRITPFGKRCFIVGDGTTAAAPGTGLMSPRVGVAAHHQANVVLRLLLEKK
ncbi:MAG: sulfur carrier protein ThiS adenylyltransferase ThiF [Deltaproteobacteria bacterium]|nr:sulfur carrier protein ThiS adenylyltransferase ThiF [Deltaproteobacteria bacterium]